MSCKLAKFGDHRNCGSGDIMFLVCHTIQQDHVIEGSFDFNDCHRQCGSGNIMILVSHVIVQDHLTKGLNNFIGGSQLSSAPSCQVWYIAPK